MGTARPSASVPAYPLQWPSGTPRTKAADRTRSPFKPRAWNQTMRELRRELEMLGAAYIVISTNQPIRADGEPYAATRNISDPGVAVYFMHEGKQICFPCDSYYSMLENLRALTLHVEHFRGLRRYGVGTSQQAFAGYAALPANAGDGIPWRQVLGLPDDFDTRSRDSATAISAAYLSAMRSAHPDAGGSHEKAAQVNLARQQAAAEFEATLPGVI